MRRPALILAALVAVLAAAQGAAGQPRELMPGVTYEKQVQFTAHGPVAVHVLAAPRPGGLYALTPVLSNESIPGTETVTAMERRVSFQATVAGVNGDFFSVKDGHPSGILIRNGALDHEPSTGRSSIGIDSSGALRVERVAHFGTWQGTGPRRAVNEVNAPPGVNGVSLYTTAWGPATPATPVAVEVVLLPFPAAAPNVELTGTVAQVASGGTGTAIPAGGAVLVARGTAAARLQAEAPAGGAVRIRLILQPDWAGVVDALGGGPVLVQGGKPVFRADEAFTTDQLLPRHPRTAVGQLVDGRIVMIAVDGRQPAYSSGMTNFELAQTLVRLGAVTGSALDGGGSTAMAFEGQLLSRPSGGTERPVANALLVGYLGVYAPLPSEPVLSPNGDGIAEIEQLSYKAVRPSSVTASLVGPDGVARSTFSGQVEPGVYPLAFNGLTPDGRPEVEGSWHWVVNATDDLGRVSAIDRAFSLNLTLGFPREIRPALAVPRRNPRAIAAFTLTRPAVVRSRIETRDGTVLRTLRRQSYEAGTVEVAWDGVTRTGAVVYAGRYVARVIATNELGAVALTKTFSVRRLTK